MDKKTVDAYNKIAKDYQKRNSVSIWGKEYEIFQQFVGSGKSVLDIGCGIGRDASHLIELGFVYTGLDASEGMLQIAKESKPNADFRLGDFYHLPYDDAHFDCFWAVASFLHVPKSNLAQVLKEASRVTKTKGFGVIAVKEQVEFDEGVIREPKAGGIERYFAFYSEPEMRQSLEANGFTVKEVTREKEDDEERTMWLCFFVQKNR